VVEWLGELVSGGSVGSRPVTRNSIYFLTKLQKEIRNPFPGVRKLDPVKKAKPVGPMGNWVGGFPGREKGANIWVPSWDPGPWGPFERGNSVRTSFGRPRESPTISGEGAGPLF